MILILPNVTIELSNMRKKKIRVLPNVTKELSHMILELGIAQCENEIVKCDKKRSKETTKYDKKTVTYDIGTAQCENETVKYEKKKV